MSIRHGLLNCHQFVFASCLALFLSTTGVADEPAAELLRKGDIVRIAIDGAPVKVQADTIARFPHGRVLTVQAFQYPWVWISEEERGKTVEGWLPVWHLQLPQTVWTRAGVTLQTDDRGRITFMDFSDSTLEDPSLYSLHNLPELRDLILDGAALDRLAISHLTRLSKLEVLVMRDCELPENSVDQLWRLRNLQLLTLTDSTVPQTDIETLQARLPQVQVVP